MKDLLVQVFGPGEMAPRFAGRLLSQRPDLVSGEEVPFALDLERAINAGFAGRAHVFIAEDSHPEQLPVKMFEVRDRMTMIPVIAIAMTSGEESEHFLLRRAGYDAEQLNVLLVFLSKGKAEYDPWSWGDRTLHTAHLHILDHWDELKTGAVIDVEFILGESAEVKTSEREK